MNIYRANLLALRGGTGRWVSWQGHGVWSFLFCRYVLSIAITLPQIPLAHEGLGNRIGKALISAFFRLDIINWFDYPITNVKRITSIVEQVGLLLT
jgi:hypothetical protein